MKKYIIISILLSIYNSAYSQKVIDEAKLMATVVTSDLNGNALSKVNLVTYLKDDRLKILSTLNQVTNITFLDRKSQTITSLFEIKGEKIGFFIPIDSSNKGSILEHVTVENSVDSIKSINGFKCHLAYLKYDSLLKMKPVKVWYDPSIKMADPTMGLNILGIEKIKGLLVSFESENDNMIIHYFLTNIEYEPINDNFFDMKGYKIFTFQQFTDEVKKLNADK